VTVGLVIVTYNAAAEIARCLEAVAAQTRRPDRLIVADSGSRDKTIAIAAATAARLGLALEVLTLGSNVGFAVANNRAVDRLENCDAIALLNPDAFPEPAWLAALLDAAASHGESASFASRLMLEGHAGVLDGAGDIFHVSGIVWRHGHRQQLERVPDALVPRPVFAACAAAALYRRVDWRRAGGFDERYFCYAEDVDLGFRLQLLGRGCWYVPDAVVHHVGSSSGGRDSAFSVYFGYRNLEWTFVKNMPSRLFWRYLPVHVAVSAAEFVWFLARGRGLSLLRAKRDALAGLRQARHDRTEVQAGRVIADDAVRDLLDRSSLIARFVSRAGRLG
jgi:GT2 family glycosyltransferase